MTYIFSSLFLGVLFPFLTALVNLVGYQVEEYPCLGDSFGWPVGFYHAAIDYGILAMPGCLLYFNTLGFVSNILFWFILSFFILNLVRRWRQKKEKKLPSS